MPANPPVAPANDILSIDEAGLLRAIGDMGEPAYRASQVFRWLYGNMAGTFAEMTNLPAGLRQELSERFTLSVPVAVERVESRDGTRKFLWEFADGERAESVGIPDGRRLTVCFSTQVGCAMGCTFCATGLDGLSRSLGPGEMALQVALTAADFGTRASNAVAMGQGEPFANYEATLGGLRILNSPDALGIGARHLTVSTCGLIPGIERFASEPEQFTLAVSLHSAVQSTRDRLMPSLTRYPLAGLRAVLAEFATTGGRRPTLEYALIEGVNDTDSELGALVAFCKGMLIHVNLIPANPVAGIGLQRASATAVERFRKGLEHAGVDVSVRAERGADIDAACGQLRRRFSDGLGAASARC